MAFNFIEIESLVQMFSSEFCEVSKNTFFTEQLRTTVSVFSFFPATLLKWDTAKSVRKTLDEHLYLETLTLEVTFRYIISFSTA